MVDKEGMLSDLALCPPIAFHVILRPVDQRVIVRDAADRRLTSGVILALGDECGLVMHHVADTHVHALLVTDRASAGRFAHAVETSLRWRLRIPVPFEPAAIRPIRTQGHVGTTFWYIVDQRSRHGIVADPLHDGSSLVDVVGARAFLVTSGSSVRRLGATVSRRVASLLPRVKRSDLMQRLGGSEILDAPCELEDLADAAAAAVGVRDLRQRGPVRSEALAAAVAAGQAHGTSALSHALRVTTRAIQRHRHLEPMSEVVRALGLQWRMRAHRRRLDEAETARLLALPEASCVLVDADAWPPPSLGAPPALVVARDR